MSAGNYQYQFVAGNLALDFVNTVAYRFHPDKVKDHLQCAEDVRRWADQAQLPYRNAIRLGPRISGSALARVRAARESLFAIFHRVTCSQPIPGRALREINDVFGECSAQRCISMQGSSIRWTWRSTARPWHLLLYPVLTAAADLLTSGASGSVRQCADSTCGWLFLDRSNAGRRRWCSMADCGNRNKAREHHRRQKSARSGQKPARAAKASSEPPAR